MRKSKRDNPSKQYVPWRERLPTSPRVPQIAESPTTPRKIMRRAAFQRGVADVRAGRKPRFDEQSEDDAWDYERKRQWAIVAPADMPLTIDRRLNPAAVKIFSRSEFI